VVDVAGSYADAPAEKRSGMGRIGVAVFGVAAVIVGVVLLFNPVAAARTLALFVGLALLIGGALEIALAWGAERRALAVLPGVILLVGGVLALVWPGVTLWTLAVLAGVSLLVQGVTRIALAVAARAEVHRWGWLAAAGALNAVVGVLALVWPGATVLVLSLMVGIQILLFGVLLLAAAFTGSSRAPA
jgi:uncharacterized membrane protein HdeD (DUF308 family)